MIATIISGYFTDLHIEIQHVKTLPVSTPTSVKRIIE
jgi:hypothetical protein